MLAMIYPDGRILADSGFMTYDDVWKVCLGWPDSEEIANAKRLGYKVRTVTVEIME
jgi:hypothetical protein